MTIRPFDLRKSQLSLDDEIIEQTVRLRRVVHQPQKYVGNPVYTVGAPREGRGTVYPAGVYRDPKDSVWKAWYATLGPPGHGQGRRRDDTITIPPGERRSLPLQGRGAGGGVSSVMVRPIDECGASRGHS